MVTSKELLLVAILSLCIIGSGLTACGMFWVTSNVVHVDAQYTITLSTSGSKNVISLTARVRYNGNPIGEGINVDFYYSLNGGNWTYFATQPTNRGGVARTTYRTTVNGNYEFKAKIANI